MQREDYENYPKEVKELMLKMAKAPRKRKAAIFQGAKVGRIKPLLPAHNSTKER